MQPKLRGTFVPLFALKTNQSSEVGTILAGMNFLDWLVKTHQNAWQMLPINETQLEDGSGVKHILSPYKSYGIGIDPKYLSKDMDTPTPTNRELDEFVRKNSKWITDYALFCTLRDKYETDDWTKWEGHTQGEKETYEKEMQSHIVVQWKLHYQFCLLKAKAAKMGISLIGDMPFYLSHRSPLVWANQSLFDLESDGSVRHASGIPKAKGKPYPRQFWGHPLYEWGDKEKYSGIFNLWKTRIQYTASLYDWTRLDHAGGFYHYGSLGVKDATNDQLVKGPGTKTLRQIVKYCDEAGLGVYLENIGANQKDLNQEIDRSHFFQIQVWMYGLLKGDSLQFNVKNAEVPRYTEKMFVYTSTHDTETLMSFVEKLSASQEGKLAKKSGIEDDNDPKEYCRRIIEAISNSDAYGVIVPIQDRLYAHDRINIPGTEKKKNDKNWKYVLKTPVEDLPTEW